MTTSRAEAAASQIRIDPDLLLRAYSIGVFPMAESRDADDVMWIDPKFRGVLPLESFHVPKRLARTIRRDPFEVRADFAFRKVMEACASPAAGREDSWINPSILGAYCTLYERGRAHSVECWREGQLVGGLYGVSMGAAFFGESMFSFETDASKVALVHLVARLKAGGYRLLDIQFVTAHLSRFGAVELPREAYHDRLYSALAGCGDFKALGWRTQGSGVLQLISQTS